MEGRVTGREQFSSGLAFAERLDFRTRSLTEDCGLCDALFAMSPKYIMCRSPILDPAIPAIDKCHRLTCLGCTGLVIEFVPLIFQTLSYVFPR